MINPYEFELQSKLSETMEIYATMCEQQPISGPLAEERQRLGVIIESLLPAVTSRNCGELFGALRDFNSCGRYENRELDLLMGEMELLAFKAALFRRAPNLFGAGAINGETLLAVCSETDSALPCMTFSAINGDRNLILKIIVSPLGFHAPTGVVPDPEPGSDDEHQLDVAPGQWAIFNTTFPSMRALLTHFDFFGCPGFAADIAAIASDLGPGRLFREGGYDVSETSVETHQCNLFGFAPCPKCDCGSFCAILQKCGMCYD